MKIFFSQGAYNVDRKEIRYTKKVENKIYYMTNCVIQTNIEVYASRIDICIIMLYVLTRKRQNLLDGVLV